MSGFGNVGPLNPPHVGDLKLVVTGAWVVIMGPRLGIEEGVVKAMREVFPRGRLGESPLPRRVGWSIIVAPPCYWVGYNMGTGAA